MQPTSILLTARRRFVLALCLSVGWLSGLVVAPAVQAQADSEAAPASSFGAAVDVNVVNLDIFVTDRKGNFVEGLSPDDFTIQVDGDRVSKIDFFEQVTAGAVPAEKPQAAAPAEEAADTAAEEATPPLRLAVLVDNRNLSPANRNRVLGELETFLEETLDRGAEVLIMTHDGSLNVRQTFTSDRAELAAALEQTSKLPAARFAREAERRTALSGMQNVIRMLSEQSTAGPLFAAAELDSVLRQIVFFAQSSHSDVVDTVSMLRAVVLSLGALPGRKALVYVSDGLPLRPGDSLVTALQQTLQDGRSVEGVGFGDQSRSGSGDGDGFGSGGGGGSSPPPLSSQVASLRSELVPYDTSPLFTELTALANARRVTFYPVNGAGGDIALLGADSPSDIGAVASPAGYLTADLADLRDSLRLMADETGGVALAGGTDVDGWLENVQQDLRNYYSLGLTMPALDKPQLHRIKVKVKGRGNKARFRQSFVTRSGDSLQQDRTAAALLLGAVHDPLGLQVQVEGQQGRDDGAVDVALMVAIPLDKLGFVTEGEEARVELKLYFASLSDTGRVSPVGTLPLAIRVPAERLEEARSQSYGAQLPVALPPGEQKIVLGLWDATAGINAQVTKTIEVAAPEG
ncbi:MAG: VWA domain-containing protein [Acidobacteriota bacterium]|nr:VWA domain-containing protein [Acidobacteriota bacterium]